MPTNLENSAVATGLEKVSFHSSPKEKQCQRMFKLSHQVAKVLEFQLISHIGEVMHKIVQGRIQQYVNSELSDVLLVLVKAEEREIKLPTSTGSWEKQESSRKTSTSALLARPKPLTLWITINCGKFLKRREYQTI